MPRLQLPTDLPFEVGALYHRRQQIHGLLGGQQQGGISTPGKAPFVILFTGEAGSQHGYWDHWEIEDGQNVFHYYGEGQSGDMQDTRGNRAIREHSRHGRRLLMFQNLGKGQPYRFWGEFRCIGTYHGVRDTPGALQPQPLQRQAGQERIRSFQQTLPTASRRRSTVCRCAQEHR